MPLVLGTRGMRGFSCTYMQPQIGGSVIEAANTMGVPSMCPVQGLHGMSGGISTMTQFRSRAKRHLVSGEDAPLQCMGVTRQKLPDNPDSFCYRAEISVAEGHTLVLGEFSNKQEAAQAYDKAAVALRASPLAGSAICFTAAAFDRLFGRAGGTGVRAVRLQGKFGCLGRRLTAASAAADESGPGLHRHQQRQQRGRRQQLGVKVASSPMQVQNVLQGGQLGSSELASASPPELLAAAAGSWYPYGDAAASEQAS
eukprot:gene3259-3537_t